MSWRVLTVVSACVALLLAIAWRSFAPPDPGAPPPAIAKEAASTDSAALGSDSATAAVATPTARSEAPSPPNAHRRARIVDETGAPVAGAEVAFDLARGIGDGLRTFPIHAETAAGFDIETWSANALRFRSAGDGIVALPTDASTAFLIARAGERFGCRVIDFSDRFYDVPELRIAPDRTLHIAVVGPRGEPCPNVPVEVAYQNEQALVGPGMARFRLPRTDAAGCVTFWHAQMLCFWDPTDPTLELRALVLGASPPARRIRLADSHPAVIQLTCPEHGRIRVRAWCAEGVPSPVDLDLYVREIVDGKEILRDPLATPGSSGAEVLLHPVATGRQWMIGASGFGDRSCDGPGDRNEVAVDLIANGKQRLVTGLLLQPDLLPCACLRIRTDLDRGPPEVPTDATGRFHLAVAPESTGITLHAAELHASASVALPTAAASDPPIVDLGVIRLTAQELLAAGKVVDAMTKQPLRAFLRAEQGIEAFEPISQAYSACDGSFELWGSAEGDVRIRAQKDTYTTSFELVRRGSRDLVVAMQPSRQLRARVLVDPGIWVDGLGVRVLDGDDRVGWNTSLAEPGQLTCLFTLPESDDLVLEVAGAEDLSAVRQVPRSEWAGDGTLCATVDLRGVLANVLVAIHADAAGETEGSLYVKALGSSASWASLDLAPRLAFAAPKGALFDAIVRPDFGMCVRATLHPGENTIGVPPPSVAQIEVLGVPPGIARTNLAVQVRRLVRREPLLDELVASGLDVDPGEVQDWPRSAADLRNMDGEDLWQEFGAGPLRFELRRRGSYVAVPYVVAKQKRIALLDAAVSLEITTPGAVVDAAIRLDPEKVRAALK